MTHLDHLAGRDAGASFLPALRVLTRHHRLPQELIPTPAAPSLNRALAFHVEVDFCWDREACATLLWLAVCELGTQTPPKASRKPLDYHQLWVPGGPWSISRPGHPWHLQVPQQTGTYETCSSAGRSQAVECEGAPSHHTMAEVMAREETQAKALPRGRKRGPGRRTGTTVQLRYLSPKVGLKPVTPLAWKV